MWDTGADDHLGRPHLAKGWPTWESAGPTLVDVQNNQLEDYGTAEVTVDLIDGNDQLHACTGNFRVTDTNENVMSAGKAIRADNFRAVLDKDGSYLENKRAKVRVPLYLRRNSFYLIV